MIYLHVDPHSGVPVYRQIMDQMNYYVASGTLRPGDQVPSIRSLAKQLRVNPSTIVKAYDELRHRGVIELRHGRGAFISQAPKRVDQEECLQAIRRLARQLAVESHQMGVKPMTAVKIVEEEMTRIKEEQQNG